MTTEDMDKTALGVINSGEATQMFTQPGIEATQYAANVTCPVCQTPNPPSETYCIDCGFMLSSEPVAAGEIPEGPSYGSLVTTDGTREFVLKPGVNTVGRQDADILLAHNTVSRKHATVIVEGGKVYVEDPGSTNGTTVNGAKVAPGERVELADGAEVVFGSQALTLKAGDGKDESSVDVRDDAEESGVSLAAEGWGPAADGCVDESVVDGEGEELESEEAGDSEPQLSHPEVIEGHMCGSPVARLVSADGALTFDLFDGVAKVGRRDGNDIVIPDPYCSGSHAEVKIDSDEIVVTDIGSTNGSMVNGVKLEPDAPKVVQPGDEITFGQTAFKIEAPE